MLDGRALLERIWSLLGCAHPFRVSRIAALAELEWLQARGARLTNLKYVRGPGVFYIEGIKELVEGSPCFERREDRGCIEYKCRPPELPRDVEVLVERLVSEASGLSDDELNKRVVNHPLYDRLFEG